MKQIFHFPVSTTPQLNVAQNFEKDNGITLKLKAANSKTTAIDVSFLSRFPNEEETLIMGSSLKIVDIYIGDKVQKNYISAIQLFEQIIDGRFIDEKENDKHNAEDLLYTLFLMKIGKKDKITKENMPSKYIMALFDNMIDRMQQQKDNGTLWLNRNEFDKIKHVKLKQFLSGEFLKHFEINLSDVNQIKEFEWKIKEKHYNKFKNMKPTTYIIRAISMYYK